MTAKSNPKKQPQKSRKELDSKKKKKQVKNPKNEKDLEKVELHDSVKEQEPTKEKEVDKNENVDQNYYEELHSQDYAMSDTQTNTQNLPPKPVKPIGSQASAEQKSGVKPQTKTKKKGGWFKYFTFLLLGILFISLTLGTSYFLSLQAEAKESIEVADKAVQRANSKGLPNSDKYSEKIKKLEQKSNNTYLLNELQEISQEAQEVSERVNNEYLAVYEEKKNTLIEDVNQFEKEFASYETVPLPSRTRYKDFIKETRQILDSGPEDITTLENLFTQLKKNEKDLATEADTVQKKLFLESIQDSLVEADELIAYFSYGYDGGSQLNNLQAYKSGVVEITNSSLEYDEMVAKYEEQVLPNMEKAVARKNEIDEEYKRQRKLWIQQEAERRAANGLGPAPAAPLDREKLIYVDIAGQYLYGYDQGELVVSSPVVTGKTGFETVRGEYKIYTKTTNQKLISPFTTDKNDPLYYEVMVNYWMPFYSGYGLHDATWRGSFGGDQYIYNGSHGCVNMPLWLTEFIWSWAEIGTPVYVN
jgi:lipoprotein-anchoring transpeptidase ErfK/SrfK